MRAAANQFCSAAKSRRAWIWPFNRLLDCFFGVLYGVRSMLVRGITQCRSNVGWCSTPHVWRCWQ
jgi:hypothetical protein